MDARAAKRGVVALGLLWSALSGAGEPRKVELEKDKPTVAEGVTYTLRNGLYAHLSGSRNHSMMTVDVERGSERRSVTLTQTSPGPHEWKRVLGLELAVDYIDPYHQPLRGALLVRPAS